MLLTTIEELRALSPTSKWADSELKHLLSLIEEEEEGILTSILGDELYEQIDHDYSETIDGITEVETAKQKIIRCCQRIVYYRMLANNSGLFSVSFNRGGGLSMMSTDTYEPADNETIKRFERDAWGKSNSNIETLLGYLEKDAKSDKFYSELWAKSDYYYYHKNLLFKTSRDLDLYLHLPNKEKRRTFISLVPTIDLCQDTYIIPRIGHDKFQRLLSDSWKEEANPDTLSTWEALSQHVRRALANYVANENKSLRTEKSLLHADMQIALAEKIVKGMDETNPTTPPEKKKCHIYDIDDPDNAVLDLGGLWHS